MQLCGLHVVAAVSTAGGSGRSSGDWEEGGTSPEPVRQGHKRHASWAHLPGMEDRISEALARHRFLRPRYG